MLHIRYDCVTHDTRKHIVPALIGAGATLAGSVIGAVSSSNANKNKGVKPYVNSGDYGDYSFSKDGLLAGDTSASRQAWSKMPQDVYWSQLQNEYNINQQQKMYEKQLADSRENWNMENAYNTPAAQARRLLAAGINPTLALQNQGTVGQAENVGSTSTPSMGSPAETGSVAAGTAAAASNYSASTQFGVGLINALSQVGSAYYQNQSMSEDIKKKRIDNQYEQLRMVAELRKLAAESGDKESSAKYRQLEYFILNESKEALIQNNIDKSAFTHNELTLQDDMHKINQYIKLQRYYEQALAEKNLSWYDTRQQKELAEVVSRTALNGSLSRKAVADTVESYNRSKGINLDNKQKERTIDDLVKITHTNVDATSTALELAKAQLEQARYANDNKAITYWMDRVEQLTRSIGNVAGAAKVFK